MMGIIPSVCSWRKPPSNTCFVEDHYIGSANYMLCKTKPKPVLKLGYAFYLESDGTSQLAFYITVHNKLACFACILYDFHLIFREDSKKDTLKEPAYDSV